MKLLLIFLLLPTMLTAESYSIEMRNAPVADVIRLLVSLEGKNVVIPGDVDGVVTASFSEIGLSTALDSVLESNQLVGTHDNGILQIETKKTQEAQGRDLKTRSFVLNYAKAKDVSIQAKPLVTNRGSIIADEPSNTVTIRGTEDQIKSLQTFINTVDRVDRQVLIEAKIVQASRSFTRNLGIQWGVNSSGSNFIIGGLSGTTSVGGRPLSVNTPSVNPLSGVSAAIGPLGSTFLDAQLSMGEENGDLTILARPSIVTMNNRAATIRSGTTFYVKTAGTVNIGTGNTGSSGSAPVTTGGTATGGTTGGSSQTGSGSSVSGTLSTVQAGITLIVTPHITPDNRIDLVISVISSQPGAAGQVDGIPSIDDNTATSTVLLEDGATTVIGGLSQMSKQKTRRGFPILSKIPILNLIFGSSDDKKTNQELLIFITPTVVKEAIKQLKGFETKQLNRDDG